MSHSIDDLWPPYGLSISRGALTLSPVRDSDLPELVALARDGIHDSTDMPFGFPWTQGTPDEVTLRLFQYHWEKRSTMSPAQWTLELTVRLDGRVVGCQGISTQDFVITRTGETGSWLGAQHQSRGTGTLMRQALCEFVFDHLGAEEITSSAFLDNPASLAVSRKVGYQENGVARRRRREGEMALSQQLVVTPEHLIRGDAELHVVGASKLRRFLGVETALNADKVSIPGD